MLSIDIFDIILIKDKITFYLSTKDLAQCTQVCRPWFIWFMLTLQHTIDFFLQVKFGPLLVTAQDQSPYCHFSNKDKDVPQGLASSSLEKHNAFIHTLSVYRVPFILTDPGFTFTPSSTSTLSSAHTYNSLHVFKWNAIHA